MDSGLIRVIGPDGEEYEPTLGDIRVMQAFVRILERRRPGVRWTPSEPMVITAGEAERRRLQEQPYG